MRTVVIGFGSAVLLFVLLMLAAAPDMSPPPGLFPFVLPWDDARPGITDVSGWNERPAGRHGFIKVADGHLYAGSTRIRFLGANLVFAGNFPRHEDAGKLSSRMSKFGINCVRLHSLDEEPPPRGLLNPGQSTPDREQLDKLDYLIARLKDHGIYVDIVLHAGRTYSDFPQWSGMPLFFKGTDIFFPPMIADQKTYAVQLLNHVNAYTGIAYKDDPVVAFVEVNNEDGLLTEWWKGHLDDMPDPYHSELSRQWNLWLRKRYASIEDRHRVWGDPPGARDPDAPIALVSRRGARSLGPAAQRDWIRFLWDTEEAYWTEMYSFLKKVIPIRSLIIGTQSTFSPVQIQERFDVMDDHAYWQHPRFQGRAWDPERWTVSNIPMAGVADGGTLPGLTIRRVIGKPFICSEYNHPAPNTYSSEAFILTAAYAALHDWDGLFVFDYSRRKDDWSREGFTGFFDVDRHTTKMATLPPAAALFLRPDIRSPGPITRICETQDDAIEHFRSSGPILRPEDLGLPPLATLEGPVGMAPCAALSALHPSGRPKVVHDRMNQLRWDPGSGRGMVSIDTPRSKALLGYVAERPYTAGEITITPGKTIQGWAAITLTVIDGENFESAGRILVTATGYTENAHVKWKDREKSSVGKDWGEGPVMVEGIPATIRLPRREDAAIGAWPLDVEGQRKDPMPVDTVGESWVLRLGPEHRTIWYEIDIQPREDRTAPDPTSAELPFSAGAQTPHR